MATFVLVHGSFHGGWRWQKVARLLRESVHEVHTPTMTGLGERSHLATRQAGLDLHIQDIINVLEFEDLHDVVLVGHSYAGLVITGVAEYMPQRVRRLVYLDAITPNEGQSAFDLMPGTEGLWTQRAVAQGDGWLVPAMSPEMMGITNRTDAAWAQSRLRPMPLLTHQQRYHVSSPAALKVPRTYIQCTEFGFQATAREAQKLGWDYFQIESGHDAMITKPKELVEILNKTIMN